MVSYIVCLNNLNGNYWSRLFYCAVVCRFIVCNDELFLEIVDSKSSRVNIITIENYNIKYHASITKMCVLKQFSPIRYLTSYGHIADNI